MSSGLYPQVVCYMVTNIPGGIYHFHPSGKSETSQYLGSGDIQVFSSSANVTWQGCHTNKPLQVEVGGDVSECRIFSVTGKIIKTGFTAYHCYLQWCVTMNIGAVDFTAIVEQHLRNIHTTRVSRPMQCYVLFCISN